MNQNHRRLLLVLAIVAARAPLAAQQVRRTLPGTRPDTATATPEPLSKPHAAPAKAGFGVIDGLVTDTSLVPLRGARVSVLRTSLEVGTGPNGRFRIVDVPSGQYIIIVRRVGFRPSSQVLQVDASDTLRISYTLSEAPTELAPVTVTTQRQSPRMMEFEARRKAGLGEFMTEDQIDRHNSAFPTELLRMFSSINVTPTSTGGEEIYYPVSARATGGGTSTGLAACFMTVYVDNVPMPVPFNLDLLPSPREMAGIEVYAGTATMPIQYAGFGKGCGVILVWTKDGFAPPKKP
jgi:hypothetical protein